MATEQSRQRAEVGPALDLSNLRDIRPSEYLTRFALGATVSIAAAIIGKVVSPRFGGMFLAFPAILPASLTLLETKQGTHRAGRDAIGAVLGGVALVAFAGIGESAIGRLPGPVALVLSLVGWLAVSVALYALLAALRPEDCDARRD